MSIWSRIERRLSELADDLIPDEHRDQLTTARELIDDGRAAEAAELLDALLAARPDHVAALSLHGAAQLGLGRPAEARVAFERALRQRPDAPEALIGLGDALAALASAAARGAGRAVDANHASAAIAAYRRAVRHAAGDRAVLAASYRGLGMLYRAQGELDKAVRELRKAVAEDPDDPLARAALGEALLADPRISAVEARDHLERAARADRAPALAHIALGRIALDEADAELAAERFEAALSVCRTPAPAEGGSGEPAGEDAGTGATDADPAEARTPAAIAPASAGGRDRDRRDALIGLGDAALLARDTRRAHECYLQALALDPRSPAIHARIGDIHRAIGDRETALQSYWRALAMANADARPADHGAAPAGGAVADRASAPDGDRRGAYDAVLRRALDTAIESRALDDAVRLANDLLARDPASTRAMVARGMAFAAAGQIDTARATFRAALAGGGDDAEVHVALAELELDADPSRDAGSRAALEALAALRALPAGTAGTSGHGRARAVLAAARERELGDASARESARERELGDASARESAREPAPDSDRTPWQLAGQLAAALQRAARARPALADLVVPAAQAAADLDQPLLVTVMGEFSSGKSTFVNAFIGADVAPTGITPTTATINVVKYGRERGGRIVYRDGRIATLRWDEVFPALRRLTAGDARAIELVEILLPLPQLEKVNLVDTPGLNSILPEHEEVARAFIARADAVVWLFTANQAGKASEREALRRIHDAGKRALGVLNKKDQLAAREVDELCAYVARELADLVEVVVPVSARQALDRRHPAGGDASAQAPPAVDASNWDALMAALEQRFFAKARQIKQDACSRKLAAVIARARGIVGDQRGQAVRAADTLREASSALHAAAGAFIDDTVAAQRTALRLAVGDLLRLASREVLELVRPRELPFGSHTATAADRAYLLSLLDTGYEAALAAARREVASTLQSRGNAAVQAVAGAAEVIGADAASEVARAVADSVHLVSARVFDRGHAFVRGYLRGGYVSNFFERDLPKIALEEDAVYRALFRDSPDLDAELSVRLADAGSSALAGLAERLDRWAGVAEVLALDIDVGIGRALDAFAARADGGGAGAESDDGDAASADDAPG